MFGSCREDLEIDRGGPRCAAPAGRDPLPGFRQHPGMARHRAPPRPPGRLRGAARLGRARGRARRRGGGLAARLRRLGAGQRRGCPGAGRDSARGDLPGGLRLRRRRGAGCGRPRSAQRGDFRLGSPEPAGGHDRRFPARLVGRGGRAGTRALARRLVGLRASERSRGRAPAHLRQRGLPLALPRPQQEPLAALVRHVELRQRGKARRHRRRHRGLAAG